MPTGNDFNYQKGEKRPENYADLRAIHLISPPLNIFMAAKYQSAYNDKNAY